MILASIATVFVLGVRHGADPDHLAAIDNLTRNSIERQPLLSRFVGTLFAGGHSVMVLSIAALVGLLGTRFAAYGSTIERIGTWLSILVLIAIALLNLQQLRSGSAAGVRTKLLPKRLREATSALAAIPVGLLFGLGFETSSQIATYAVAFTADAGLVGAVLVGATFCIGMIASDTLDSVLVYRLIGRRGLHGAVLLRTWIWAVTIVALSIAGYELAQVLGWHSPFPDLAVSGTIVTFLIVVFAYVFLRTGRVRAITSKGESLS